MDTHSQQYIIGRTPARSMADKNQQQQMVHTRHKVFSNYWSIILIHSLQGKGSALAVLGKFCTHWVTLSFRSTKVLRQTLNPTAELWCKTLSWIKVDLVLHQT